MGVLCTEGGLFGANLALGKPPGVTTTHPSAVGREAFGLPRAGGFPRTPVSSPPPLPTAEAPRPTPPAEATRGDADGEALLLLLRQCQVNKKLRKKMHQKDLAKEKQLQERLAAHSGGGEAEARRRHCGRSRAAMRRAKRDSMHTHTTSRRQERQAKQSKRKHLKNTARLFYFESDSEEGDARDRNDIYFVFESESDGGDEDCSNYRVPKRRKEAQRKAKNTKAVRAHRAVVTTDEDEADADSDLEAWSSSSSELIVGSTVFVPEESAGHHAARGRAALHPSLAHTAGSSRRGRESDVDRLADDIARAGRDHATGGDADKHHAAASSFFISPIHQSVAEETTPWASGAPQYHFLGYGGLSGGAAPGDPAHPEVRSSTALQREARRAQEEYQLLGDAPRFVLPGDSRGAAAMAAFRAKGRGLDGGAPAPPGVEDASARCSRKHQRQRWGREEAEGPAEARGDCIRTSGYVYADDDAVSHSSHDDAEDTDDDTACGRRRAAAGGGSGNGCGCARRRAWWCNRSRRRRSCRRTWTRFCCRPARRTSARTCWSRTSPTPSWRTQTSTFIDSWRLFFLEEENKIRVDKERKKGCKIGTRPCDERHVIFFLFCTLSHLYY
ncbi:GETHR pentapeptide [Strigomonas culicis]|uniref:GETHR pentapeptide n=1 Tax=Strigomonas culicis TaxID=28005 RepID=S9UM79_9TRYP|nr:GETHR pentapeptide [Strigomonas culicis]|eukprot:EPY15811.1 GETHR pentapeptide [Strigomonas culicis]